MQSLAIPQRKGKKKEATTPRKLKTCTRKDGLDLGAKTKNQKKNPKYYINIIM
jgi:hypothetical protein